MAKTHSEETHPFILRLRELGYDMLRYIARHEACTVAPALLRRVDDSLDKQMTAPGRLENYAICPHTYG